MRTISSEIIEAMPIDLVNKFRTKALCLMSDLMEEMEMRFGTLTADEINFFKVLKSINSDQERFDGMSLAFGKLLYAHQVIDEMYDSAAFTSWWKNEATSNENDIPWGDE
jgi:hypothetical protein